MSPAKGRPRPARSWAVDPSRLGEECHFNAEEQDGSVPVASSGACGRASGVDAPDRRRASSPIENGATDAEQHVESGLPETRRGSWGSSHFEPRGTTYLWVELRVDGGESEDDRNDLGAPGYVGH